MSLTKKALHAAATERAKHGDAGQKKGDKALTGAVRKRVLTAALLALSKAELDKLAKETAKARHQWLAGVLHYAGCLLLDPATYLANVAQCVAEKVQTWDDAQPSMPGPAHIARAAERLQQLQATAAPVEKAKLAPAKKVAKGQPSKAADVVPTKKAPPVRAKKAPALVDQIAGG